VSGIFNEGVGVPPPRILHVGCGGAPLPDWLLGTETRFDIDPNMKPDIVGSMTEMGDIGPFDIVYCCHTLEHLGPRDVHKALQEFLRVLSPNGAAIVLVPDLEDVKPTFEVMYESPSGPVTGHDMYYGHVSCDHNPYMRHLSGFISETLKDAFLKAGFNRAKVSRGEMGMNLIAMGVKA